MLRPASLAPKKQPPTDNTDDITPSEDSGSGAAPCGSAACGSAACGMPLETPPTTARSHRRIGFAPLPGEASPPPPTLVSSASGASSSDSVEQFRAIDERHPLDRAYSALSPCPSPPRSLSSSISADLTTLSHVSSEGATRRNAEASILQELLLSDGPSISPQTTRCDSWADSNSVLFSPLPTVPSPCRISPGRTSVRHSPVGTRKSLRLSLMPSVVYKRKSLVGQSQKEPHQQPQHPPHGSPDRFSNKTPAAEDGANAVLGGSTARQLGSDPEQYGESCCCSSPEEDVAVARRLSSATTTATTTTSSAARSTLWRKFYSNSSAVERPTLSFQTAVAACGATKTLEALKGSGMDARIAVREGAKAVIAETWVRLQLVKSSFSGGEVEVTHEPLLVLESRRRGTRRGLVLDGERSVSRDPAGVLGLLADVESANAETGETLAALLAWGRAKRSTRNSAASTGRQFHAVVIPVRNASAGRVVMLLSSDQQADEFCEALGALLTYSQVYGCPTIAAAAAARHS